MPRIALLSDVHGNLPALEAVHSDLKHRNVDLVINLGDHASGPLWPKDTVDFLMAQNWIQVKGNHDRQLVTEDPLRMGLSDRFAYNQLDKQKLGWLASLPTTIEYGDSIIGFHGGPQDDLEYLLESIANSTTTLSSGEEIARKLGGIRRRIVLCGHTHKQRCVKVNAATTIVNPGSVGVQGYIDEGATPHKVEIGSPHARYAIIDTDTEELHVEFHIVPYDWNRAADKARESGRNDWICFLEKGYL